MAERVGVPSGNDETRSEQAVRSAHDLLIREARPGVRLRTRLGLVLPVLVSTLLTVPPIVPLVMLGTRDGVTDPQYLAIAVLLAVVNLGVSLAVLSRRRTLLVDGEMLIFHSRGGEQGIVRSGARFGASRVGPLTWLTLADSLGEPQRVRGMVMRTGRPSKLLVLSPSALGQHWVATGKTWDSDPGALRRVVDQAESFQPAKALPAPPATTA